MYIPEGQYKTKDSHSQKEGDKNCTYTVYEVDNGFIITIEKVKLPKEGEENKFYEPELEIYISKTNPMRAKKEKETNTLNLEKLFDY